MEQYLDAMIQSMNEKSNCLKQLLEMTAQQEQAISGDNMDWDSFERLIDEKETLIDRLGELDDGFQAVFDKIRDELEGKKAQYKDRIAKLQEQIRQVTDQSNALITAEQRNKRLIDVMHQNLIFDSQFLDEKLGNSESKINFTKFI